MARTGATIAENTDLRNRHPPTLFADPPRTGDAGPVRPGAPARSFVMNRTDIPIAEPCTADWTTMTLAERGRFCGQCRKVVRELAQMTEAEARALLASPPTEGLCVRYVHDATGEILFRRDVVPVARLARVRRAAVAVLAVAASPLAATGCMGAPQTHPLMGAPPPVQVDPQPPVAQDPMPTMGAVAMPPTVQPDPSSKPVVTDPSSRPQE